MGKKVKISHLLRKEAPRIMINTLDVGRDAGGVGSGRGKNGGIFEISGVCLGSRDIGRPGKIVSSEQVRPRTGRA